MIKPGLVSITFRELSVDRIIEICVKAGIEGIEWGGDIHVPHGDLLKAGEVKEKTLKAGLKIAAYGSYYSFDSDPFSFEDVLNTAVSLGSPLIRVWAGKKGSAESDSEYYNRIVIEARTAGDLCLKAGIKLAFEYHRGTLTDTNRSALKFLKDIDHTSIFSYWQPPVGMDKNECLDGIDLIKDYLQWIHVFHWISDSGIRYPLSMGESNWKDYMKEISVLEGDRWALLEFVKDDSLENFFSDAKTLKNILKNSG